MRRGAVGIVAAALLIGGVAAGAAIAAAPPAPPGPPRAELDALQAAVESAVARVSRPAGLMFGRQSRAYHLKGYGAVVVLAPRALPRPPRRADTMEESRAFADLLGRLEQSIAEVRDPAERRRLQETVAALRAGGLPGLPMPMIAPWPRPAAPRDVASMQEEAEAFRREAERAMERAERDVRIRLQDPEDVPFALAGVPDDAEDAFPPDPPPPPAAPAAPAPAVPPAPPTARVPAIPPFPPAPPGWTFTFEAPLPEDLPPDRVVADVRRAIVAGLGAYRGGLALLGPDEFVVVAVDFVPRMADRSRTRTVVARARKCDLVEHRAGRLSADALHARVAFDEY